MIASFFGCNNPSKDKSTPGSSDSTSDKKQTVGDVSSCGKLILFQKGATVESKTFDATGKEVATSTSTVKDVTTDADGMSSTVEMRSHLNNMNTDNTVDAKYKCDGNNLYVDLNSMLSTLTKSGVKMESTPISFPLNVTAGQTLPNASFTVNVDKGSAKMKIVTTIKDRKVGNKESVTIAGVAYDCFKVTSTADAEVDMGDMDKEHNLSEIMKKSMPKISYAMWFSQDLGVAKVEIYTNDVLSSRSEVVSVKK